MSDALNFPLYDSNDGGNIRGDIFGGPHPHQKRPAAGDATPPDALQSKRQAVDSISNAAEQAARALTNESAANARPRHSLPTSDRRRGRRALISTPVRVRSVHVTGRGPDEISTTIDVSRCGILFVSHCKLIERGMDVAVTFPYCPAPGALHAEQHGRVARVRQMPNGTLAVAVAIGSGVGEDPVDSSGRNLDARAVRRCNVLDPGTTRPLVLAVDADGAARESLRIYLTNEGYDVIAVKSGAEAREVLELSIPALLIAEVEGEGLPGFELCAFVKSTNTLKKIPVLLTTRSGNPTDYSNAHSLGAVVCMAKPYRQERLGHVVRLLAPPPQTWAQKAPAPRPPDPSRRTFNGIGTKSVISNNATRRLPFISFS